MHATRLFVPPPTHRNLQLPSSWNRWSRPSLRSKTLERQDKIAVTSITVQSHYPQAQLEMYLETMNMITTSPELLHSVEELRSLHYSKFTEICKVHLSFVIDVPTEFMEGSDDEQETSTNRFSARSSSARWLGLANHKKLPDTTLAAVTDCCIENCFFAAYNLIGWLESRSPESGLAAEGLFRKTGQLVRQKRVRQLAELAHKVSVTDINDDVVDSCSAHDLAGALKSCLTDLTLFTHKLLPYFEQVVSLTPEDGMSTPETTLRRAKQLRALRILIQLLPENYRCLLKRLLELLAIVGNTETTRMTCGSLGTVFGPLLFPCTQSGQQDWTEHQLLANDTVGYMIEKAQELFQIPEKLAIDAHKHLSLVRHTVDQSQFSIVTNNKTGVSIDSNEDDEEVPSSTTVRFATVTSPVDSRSYTEQAVASLYAAVHQMPESSKKQALIRRFNAANGGLTPHSKTYKRQTVTTSNSDCSPFKKSKVGPAPCEISTPSIKFSDLATCSLSPLPTDLCDH